MNRITTTFLAAVFAFSGCLQAGIEGDGVMKTESRPISDFNRLAVAGGFRVEWSSGKPSLNISGDENLIALIRTDISGETLKIDSQESLRPKKDITIIVSSGALTDVEATGAINLKTGQISGHDLSIKATGASTINVTGTVSTLEAELTGACALNANELQTQSATLSLVGASNADVTVLDRIKASVTGACSLNYSGNPKSVEQNVTGASTVRHQQ